MGKKTYLTLFLAMMLAASQVSVGGVVENDGNYRVVALVRGVFSTVYDGNAGGPGKLACSKMVGSEDNYLAYADNGNGHLTLIPGLDREKRDPNDLASWKVVSTQNCNDAMEKISRLSRGKTEVPTNISIATAPAHEDHPFDGVVRLTVLEDGVPAK